MYLLSVAKAGINFLYSGKVQVLYGVRYLLFICHSDGLNVSKSLGINWYSLFFCLLILVFNIVIACSSISLLSSINPQVSSREPNLVNNGSAGCVAQSNRRISLPLRNLIMLYFLSSLPIRFIGIW